MLVFFCSPFPRPRNLQRSYSPSTPRKPRDIRDLARAGASILASCSLPGHILSSRCHVMIYHSSAASGPPFPEFHLVSFVHFVRHEHVTIYNHMLSSPASAFGVHQFLLSSFTLFPNMHRAIGFKTIHIYKTKQRFYDAMRAA